VFLTLVAGFSYWYWLPALNLLTVGHIGLDTYFITDSVEDACWLVLINQLATFALLWLTRPMFGGSTNPNPTQFSSGLLAHVSLALAAFYLTVRSGDQGIGSLSAIVSGQISARADVDFANYSSGAVASLIELAGIIAIWMALFSLGCQIIMRRFLTLTSIETVAALALIFIGSGTRATLLQAIFVGVMAILVRPRMRRPQPKGTPVRTIAYSLSLAALCALMGAAFIARFQDDPGYAAAGIMEAVISNVVVNNDMMRELAFVLDNISPSLEGATDFIKLPFFFMLPTFLGFHKEIPAHAILFNQLRAGIDVEVMGGNVFPGLVADFWMVFGGWMPLLFAGFICAFAIAVDKVSGAISNKHARLAYCLAMLSYLFFCFRNITGALFLVGIFGAVLIWAVCAFFDRPQRALSLE
jgi:hypothetical protein